MKTKRLFSLVLALMLVMGLIAPVGPIRAEARTLTLTELQAKFPHGKYWNHSGGGSSNNNPDGWTNTPCGSCHGRETCPNQPSDCYCNKFDGAVQCYGFALKLAYDYYGSSPRNWAKGSLSSLKAGDYIRYKNNGHSIWVTAVNGDTITYADCNSDGKCGIRWNKTISKSTVTATLTEVKSAPYPIDGGVTHTVDSSYGTNFTAYPKAKITAENIFDANHIRISSSSWIGTSDSCTIHEVYTDGCCKVTYPLDAGGTKTVYSKISLFNVSEPYVRYWISDTEYGDTPSEYKVGNRYYFCFRFYDTITGKNWDEVANSDYNFTLTFYNPDGSVKYANQNEIDYDQSWISSFFSEPGTYTAKIVMSGDYILEGTLTFTIKENPKQIHVSTTSVNLTLGGTETTTIYVHSTGYYDGDAEWNKSCNNGNISTAWGEWTDDSRLPITITANSKGTTTLTLRLKDKTTGEVLDTETVTVTVNPKGYSVSYNANGGTGAPSSQTKEHGIALTLSSTVPEWFGYTFLGWSTSSSATSATYEPGDTFSTNAATTLYAVWQAASTISSGVTNNTYTASVPFSRGYKFYTFTPSSSRKYRFESSGNLDTQLYLYDSNGNQLTSNDDSGDGNNFLLTYDFTSGRTYYLRAKLYSSGTGTFDFTAKRVYNITYNANGGSGAPSAQEKVHGTALTLSTQTPSRSGYTFLGWSTSSTATSAAYQPGATFTTNADTTLYALWARGCANGHNYTTTKTDPTCISQGYTTYTCIDCGYSYTGNLVGVTGCCYSGSTTAPTCTAQGYTTYTCIYCGGSYTAEYTSPLGHNYKDGICTQCGVSDNVAPAPAKPYKIANVVSGIHVYWKEVPGAVKYGLWRSETGKNGTYKWISNPTVPHFTDTKVESGKAYYYKITTINTFGNHSEKSDSISVTYVATPDITSRFNKAAGITLGWNKIEGAQGYAIYRKSYSGDDAWVRIATIEGNATLTWQDTSVKNNNGTAYKYTVRALAGSDMKTLSGCRNAGRSMVRLASRVLHSAVKASATSIKCSWTATSAVTGYEVRFMVGSTIYKTFTIGNFKTGTKTFTGLETGQTYKIQIRSYVKIDGMGFYSAWSTAKNVTLP